MPKKKRRAPVTLPHARPVPSLATATRFDGGAVKIEIVFQPQDAAKLTDQVVNALVSDRRKR